MPAHYPQPRKPAFRPQPAPPPPVVRGELRLHAQRRRLCASSKHTRMNHLLCSCRPSRDLESLLAPPQEYARSATAPPFATPASGTASPRDSRAQVCAYAVPLQVIVQGGQTSCRCLRLPMVHRQVQTTSRNSARSGQVSSSDVWARGGTPSWSAQAKQA